MYNDRDLKLSHLTANLRRARSSRTLVSPSRTILGSSIMSLYALKPRFQALLRPLVAWLAGKRVTANGVTVAAAVGSVTVAGVVLWYAEHRLVFLLMPLWLFARMALNAIDGMLAREFGQQSRLGAYLNEICDVLSDAALYATFAIVTPFGPISVASVIFLSILTEFAGVLGPSVGVSRRYDGPAGKSDRAFVFGALAVWIGFGGPLPGWLFWLLPLIGLLLLITTVNRVRAGLAEAERDRQG
jgi:CDP-diacylglycerol---glycerol-3-phosphate 3-phosphatidyltransferase